MVIRSGHVGVTSVLVGGVYWGVPFPRMVLWHNLSIISGVLLVALGVWKCRHWFYQGNGVMAELHVAILGFIHYNLKLAVPVLAAVVVLGVVGSHMSGKYRHWSFVHGRRID